MSKISVIVPIYKVEKYLCRCLDSILAQSFSDFDCILIDDGSPDNCGQICDEYATKDQRISVIHQSNKGIAAVRNIGVKWAFNNSDSKWITFIDSDDWVDKRYLEYLELALSEYNTKISACSYKKTSSKKNICIENIKYSSKIETPYFIYTLGGEKIESYVWGKLYEKELWKNITFPNGRQWEDLSTLHKVIFQEDKIAWVDSQLYYYFDNECSIVHKEWTPTRLDYIWAWDMLINDPIITNNDKLYNLVCRLSVLSTTGELELLERSKHNNKNINQGHIEYLKKKLRNFLNEYKRVINPSFQECRYYYELSYPRLMWLCWTCVGIRQKISKCFRKE